MREDRTFLPTQSHELPGDHLQDSGVESPRQQNPGARTNRRAASVGADPAETLPCPPGTPGDPGRLLAASSVPAPCLSAPPAAGLTRGLWPLSCPLVAIQGKPRGSLGHLGPALPPLQSGWETLEWVTLGLRYGDPVGSDKRKVLHSWPSKAVDQGPGWLRG